MGLPRGTWGWVAAATIGLAAVGSGLRAEPERASAAAPVQATYVGGKQCKKCHLKENKSWKMTKHAAAWDTVAEKYRNDDARDEQGKACVSCHLTGYGLPGGPKTMQEALDAGLEGTQCEACHGPGSAHVELAKKHEEADEVPVEVRQGIHKTPQNACIGCHNPHVSHEQYKEG